MDKNICRTGTSSIVIGRGYYSSFLKGKKNKLLKITNVNDLHNESKHLSTVRQIKNYQKYYTIPCETEYLLKPTNAFYKKLCTIITNHDILSDKILYCHYINYAGNKELIDTISELNNYKSINYWYSYNQILKFTKKMIKGLYYLHQKKICHLDIKPENIIVNTITNKYKIIDFGFASKEPFDDYKNNLKGTPGYFPKHIENDIVTEWLPKIEANDLIPVNGNIPMIIDSSLVYKIDSYCLGRVLYVLKYFYDNNKDNKCYSLDKKSNIKVSKIINLLLEKDVNKRINILDCYNYYIII
jgi:serine/threonine protein kinase